MSQGGKHLLIVQQADVVLRQEVAFTGAVSSFKRQEELTGMLVSRQRAQGAA
ncbi:hypothetical protein KTH_56320 [Thermosporothrix hazakensis]|nr:hypothetical protein KTH_56320 [Thermosporothrix hazakensis]